MKRWLLLFVLAGWLWATHAQTTLMQWLENRFPSENWQNEDLEDWWLETDSFNINLATRQQLESLLFLDPDEIETLLEYRFDYGPLFSMYELYFLPGWSDESANLLSEIAWAGPIENPETHWKTATFKTGKHQLKHVLTSCLQRKRGATDGSYEGLPVGGYLKYAYTHPLLQAHLTLEQDAYEKFSFQHNTGVDFVSANLVWQNIGPVKQLILGDYKADFGQGLVISPNAYFGQNGAEQPPVNQCKPYTSTTENGFLRGLAAKTQIKQVGLDVFGSYQATDKTGGLHRTASERKRKHQLRETLAGVHLHYPFGRWQTGLTGLFSADKTQTDTVWQRHLHVSLDYRYVGKHWTIAGETALNEALGVATLHQGWIRFCPSLAGEWSLRYYSPHFSNAHSHAFSKGKLKDETGFTEKIIWKPVRPIETRLLVSTYQLGPGQTNQNARKNGRELSVQFQWTANQSQGGWLDYRHQQQQTAGKKEEKHQLHAYFSYGNRRHAQDPLKHEFLLKAGILQLWTKTANWETGVAGYLNVGYSWHVNHRQTLQLHLTTALFDCSSYQSRVYLSLRDTGGSLTSSSFYGLGVCQNLVIGYTGRFYKTGLRITHTHYQDRHQLSSGTETISGSRKTVCKFFVNMFF